MKNRIVALIAIILLCGIFFAIFIAYNQEPSKAATATEKANISILHITQEETKTFPDIVYTTTRVNIRRKPSKKSKILVTVDKNTKLKRIGINTVNKWSSIRINKHTYYISNKYITTNKPKKIAKSVKKQIKESKISKSDLRYLSAIIYAEAGDQCKAGKQAVGIVVVNRSKSSSFANGIYNVIYQPGQFTPTTNGSFNRALRLYDSNKLPKSCISAAKFALKGNKVVTYNGRKYNLSTFHFFSGYVKNARLTIGSHMFK